MKNSTISLYHGSPLRSFTPVYGKGDERHDYSKGFYLTESTELAREWAASIPTRTEGWIHTYQLDLEGLNILDFQEAGIFAWLAELMKHRPASDSKRYRVLAARFIEKYGVDTSSYDVIKGWRADASYFYIAKAFVRDEVDVDILEELLHLGDLGIQYCLKSEKAFKQLTEVKEKAESVDITVYGELYDRRDSESRKRMKELIDSDLNKVERVFSTLV